MFSERTTLQRLLLLKALSGGGQSLVERTALGNPLTFGTDVSKPLKSLLIPFTPQQEGAGDPSPQNIRPIVAWDGVKVQQAGKNLLPLVSVHALPNGNDTNSYGTSVSVSDGIVTITQSQTTTDYEVRNYRNGYFVIRFDGFKDLLQKTKMRFSAKINVTSNPLQASGLYFAPNGIVDVEAPINDGIVSGVVNQKFDGTKDYLEIRCAGCSFTMTDIMLYPYSETDPTFEPYEGHETDISFPSPVYGGTLDVVSGVLTVEWVSVPASSLPWVYSSSYALFSANTASTDYIKKAGYTNILSNKYKTVSDALSSFSNNAIRGHATTNQIYIKDDSFDGDASAFAESGFQVVYELETPQEIQLTGHQLTALLGNNTIWSDADGSMTCVYLVSSKYAEEHPVGGLGSGLGSGLLGSGTEDNPEDPIEDPEEEIPDNTEEGSEPDD